MKKIAFFVQWMKCGGVENALIALTDELIRKGNDVTVYVIVKKGAFLQKFHKKVHLKLIPMDEEIRKKIPVGRTILAVQDCISQLDYMSAIGFLVRRFIRKERFAELQINRNRISMLNEVFDIAVNFHIHSPFLVWYVSEKVKADKKYTWIHSSFESIQYDIGVLKPYLLCIDRFFAVSQQLAEEFTKVVPEFSDQTQVAHNIVPVDQIIEKSEAFFPDEYLGIDQLILLTIGRLDDGKGYDLALQICEKLKNEGIAFQWFVLGEGAQRKWIEKEIKKRGLSDCFHLLGIRMNPYPYIKYADIYIQTSKHEGWAITITEAKILTRPIVMTNVAGAKEQLIDGINGEIAEISVESLYEKVMKLIKNKSLQTLYSQTLEQQKIEKHSEWLSVF